MDSDCANINVMKFVILLVVCILQSSPTNSDSNQFSYLESKKYSLNSQLHLQHESGGNHGHEDSTSPVLIWWNDSHFPYRNKNSTSKISCSIGHCLITLNRGLLGHHDTRGILFYGSSITPGDLPLPRQRWHEWALFHEESPLNNYILCHQSFIRLFNYTATSRRESDFPLTTQWILQNDYFTSRRPQPVSRKNKLKRDKGFAPVLYIQSHCDVPSDRDRYIRALMKHIPIDSYGKCLNNKKIDEQFKDPVENLNKPKFLDFIAKYKFHIAFENALLTDYMTEKLMRAYHVGAIPIYKGAPNAKDWMPSNKSLIFIDDFESPQHLAHFIKQLDENDDEYNAYLQYKEDGVTNSLLHKSLNNREWRFNDSTRPSMISSFECYVCDQIHKRLKAEMGKQSMPAKFANQTHFGCQQPYTLLVEPYELSRDDSWFNVDWIDLYWRAFDESLAVNAMLKAKEKDSTKLFQYLNKIYRERRKS